MKSIEVSHTHTEHMGDIEPPQHNYLYKDYSEVKLYISSNSYWLLCKNALRARTPSIHHSCTAKNVSSNKKTRAQRGTLPSNSPQMSL